MVASPSWFTLGYETMVGISSASHHAQGCLSFPIEHWFYRELLFFNKKGLGNEFMFSCYTIIANTLAAAVTV